MRNFGNTGNSTIILFIIWLTACSGLKPTSDLTILKGPNVPTGVYSMGYATDGKNIYCIGGANLWKKTNHATDDIYLLAPVIGKWKKADFYDKVVQKQATSSVYLEDLNVILSTGFAYLPKPNFYTFPIEIIYLKDYRVMYRSDNPHMALHSGVVYKNKKVYVFGGRAFNEEGISYYSDKVLSFDPFTDEWNELSPMPAPRVTYGAVAGDQLYVFGGHDAEEIYDEIWRYNITLDTWETLGRLPYAASNFGISINYPFVFLCNIGPEHNIIGRFDIRDSSFKEIKTSISVIYAGSVIVGNYLYIFGGTTVSGKTASNKTFKIPLDELMSVK